MTAIRLFPAALAVILFAAAVDFGRPQAAAAGMPAPIPTTLGIRDASEPPTPSTPAKPFVSRPNKRKPKRPRTAKRPPAPPAAQAPATAPAAQTSTGPRLEQRYQAPTESIYPLDPEPAPAPGPKPAAAAFPPEPAPVPAKP
ncbi:hypothetical protein [Solidesulfovibrio sp.]